jgi:hypothetical protein
MWNVMCRAELHGSPSREQYEDFHAGMEQLGLVRTITRDGKVFHLPTAEYLGVNLSTPKITLGLRITVLASRITGSPAKLTLAPVDDPASIYISGLEEDTSYASQLAYYASACHTPAPWPTANRLQALMELAGTLPVPDATPNYSALAFLAEYMKR